MANELHIVAGNPDGVARALMDGKPCSVGLEALYVRTLTQHLNELAAKHGVTDHPNVVMLPKRDK